MVIIQVNEGVYLLFLAKGIGDIVVIDRIRAKVMDLDIGTDAIKLVKMNSSL